MLTTSASQRPLTDIRTAPPSLVVAYFAAALSLRCHLPPVRVVVSPSSSS